SNLAEAGLLVPAAARQYTGDGHGHRERPGQEPHPGPAREGQVLDLPQRPPAAAVDREDGHLRRLLLGVPAPARGRGGAGRRCSVHAGDSVMDCRACNFYLCASSPHRVTAEEEQHAGLDYFTWLSAGISAAVGVVQEEAADLAQEAPL
ncbi:unnamed protein product, partial [Prorocentrum cordatum]